MGNRGRADTDFYGFVSRRKRLHSKPAAAQDYGHLHPASRFLHECHGALTAACLRCGAAIRPRLHHRSQRRHEAAPRQPLQRVPCGWSMTSTSPGMAHSSATRCQSAATLAAIAPSAPSTTINAVRVWVGPEPTMWMSRRRARHLLPDWRTQPVGRVCWPLEEVRQPVPLPVVSDDPAGDRGTPAAPRWHAHTCEVTAVIQDAVCELALGRQRREHLVLDGAFADQVHHVHAARLMLAPGARDALLEPCRVPRQIQVDDDARCLQVQPKPTGVGG